MITIRKVLKNSFAEKVGLKQGMKIVSINNHPINDIIDLEYYSSEEKISMLLKKDGKKWKVNINRNYLEPLGIEINNIKPKLCNNRCIFCFYDQLPPNLRESLYMKDDDYRLSFLYGNFITLTNIREDDFNEILEKRLSPLYISVHTTESDLRVEMMKNPAAGNILEHIKYLSENEIYIHTQVVLCPEINDGEHLRKTIKDLEKFYPYVKSIGIVPVGLTKYREKLPYIKFPTQEWMKEIIKDFNWLNAHYRERFGIGFVYLADEFFLKTGEEIPNIEYYDDFPQLENGIGITRLFLDDLDKLNLPHIHGKTILITGILSLPIIEKFAERLDKHNWDVQLIPVENHLFGKSVTVAGLLSGEDIRDALKDIDAERVILPPDVVNEDGIFLDNMRLEDLRNRIDTEVIVAPYRLRNLPNFL